MIDIIEQPSISGNLAFIYNNKRYVGFSKESAEALNIPENVIAAAEVDAKWSVIRVKRDGLLNASDWAAMPDSPVENKQAWLDYRTALRDLPQAFSADPDSVVWPEVPAV